MGRFHLVLCALALGAVTASSAAAQKPGHRQHERQEQRARARKYDRRADPSDQRGGRSGYYSNGAYVVPGYRVVTPSGVYHSRTNRDRDAYYRNRDRDDQYRNRDRDDQYR
ncbi:MAG TPA: hypothetical protein VF832_06700, partial [Longimicrobiales bacterium]